jgi:hypothetical protein
MRAILCLGMAAIFSVAIQTGQCQKITGRVVNALDSTAVQDAHLSYANGTSGTVTNNLGEFTLLLSPNILNSVLNIEISCIGYQTKFVRYEGKEGIVNIFLNPASLVLQEVVVRYKEDSAKLILTRAFAKIRDNYNSDNTRMNIFFREILTQEENALRLVETFAQINDPGIKKPPSKISTEIIELRRSDDLTNNSIIDIGLNFLFVKKYNPILYLLEWDIVRHYKNPATKMYISDFQFKNILNDEAGFESQVDGIIQTENDRIYKLKFFKNGSVNRSIIFFIQARDFAILKIEFEECFTNKDTTGLWRGCRFNGSIEYKSTGGKYHLYYASVRRGILPNFGSAMSSGKGDRVLYSQLLVQNATIERNKIQKSKMVEEDDNFLGKKYPYHSTFWNEHSIPLLDIKYRLAIDNLSNKIPLAKQFEANGN